MGSFQTSMLEAFKSLREELSNKKQPEVVQTSASASKPETSVDKLDLPQPRPISNPPTEDMDYGPALPPGLGSDHQNFSDQNFNTSEVPKPSDRPNKHSDSHRKHDNDPRSDLDQYSDQSDLPRRSPNPKSMLTRVNINPGPDWSHLPQTTISPLGLNTGLLSPLTLNPLGLTLT